MTDTAGDSQQAPNLVSYQLTDQQDVLLRTIASEFARNGTWPVFDYVAATLEDYRLDARKLLESLPRVPDSLNILARPSYGYTALPARAVEADTPIALTVAAAMVLPELRTLIAEPFLRVMHHMIKVYQEAPRNPQAVARVPISSQQLRAAVPLDNEAFWTALPQFLRSEIAATRRCVTTTDPQEGTWSGEIDREILQFRDCVTLEDYVAKTSQIVIGRAREASARYRPNPMIRPVLPSSSAPQPGETAQPTGQSQHLGQQLYIDSGGGSVRVTAPFAYADKDAEASAASSTNQPRKSQSPPLIRLRKRVLSKPSLYLYMPGVCAILALLGVTVHVITAPPASTSGSHRGTPSASMTIPTKAAPTAAGSSPSSTVSSSASSAVPGPQSSATTAGTSTGTNGGAATQGGPTTAVTTGPTEHLTPGPVTPATSAPAASNTFPATVRWTDDGSSGGPTTYVYDSPYKGHQSVGTFGEGNSLTVICKVTGADSITVGPSYSGPKPPASSTWYEITYQHAWAPAVYVDVSGANVPACS